MKICFIGPANSAHIIKWCNWFNKRGHEIHVISFTPGEIKDTFVHVINLGVDVDGSDLGKLKYLFSGKKIKRIINSINPDIINVHYATSYGAAVAFGNIHDYVLSVWGSDIYYFPNKSFFHKALLKYSLKKANYLFSTSRAMAKEAEKYTNKSFVITPFGVDLQLFNPKLRDRNEGGEFIVGTVKGLADTYGIKDILKAVSELKGKVPIRLRIAGKGPKEQEYHQLAVELGIDDITNWLGFISQEDAAKEWANMDVAVIPSIQESFGVSAIEAQASGIPVIISNIPGLMETTLPNVSSLTVERNDYLAIADCITELYENPAKREQMGLSARAFVEENYELNKCFEMIENEYMRIINSKC